MCLIRVHMPLYPQVVDSYSMQGYRLLALAGGVVQGVEQLHLGSMTLPQLEARTHNIRLLGLFVLTDHLRHDSRDTVQRLQDRLVLTGLKGSTSLGPALLD